MFRRELLAILLWAGCAGAASSQTARWLDVPFVQQPFEGCGAASIAMVMQYWAVHQNKRDPVQSGFARDQHSQSSDVDYIQQELYSRPTHGIYASDLQRYLQSNGFNTYVVSGDLELLSRHIERGRPLIVALKPTSAQALHYVVVVGVGPAEQVVLVNDPAQRKLLKVDSAAFAKEWKATGNWTLLALPRSAQH